ncbi:transmembrane protein 104 homolog [Agrilus planipennis]|uniref:Transmembrane protein 104 homolog n=1 Tax=Agrilus planipennis TaxID=224129 RepID=A0A7F5RLH7_AGRPL|nr:transmembrane protein 104 homolog [Agrilus planipennis]
MTLGVLILPGSYSLSGWFIGSVIIIWLGFISWLSASFLIEAQACANRLEDYRKGILDADYSLTRDYNLSELIMIMLGKTDQVMYTTIVIAELYFEAFIVTIVVGRSVAHTICSGGEVEYVSNDQTCSDGIPFQKINIYRISTLVFVLVGVVLSAFSSKKATPLHLIISIYRSSMVLAIIISAAYKIGRNKTQTPVAMAGAHQLPKLLGSTILSFMCHHSILRILYPVHKKNRLQSYIVKIFSSVICLYVIISFTAILAFEPVQEVYSINFAVQSDDFVIKKVFDYLIAVYPAVAGLIVFIEISRSLQEHLQVLCLSFNDFETYNFCIRKLYFPFFVILSVVVPLCTNKIKVFVPIAGTFGGNITQNIIPLLLVHTGRKTCQKTLQPSVNYYSSPLKKWYWPLAVFIWVAISLFATTITLIPYLMKL